MKDFGKRMKQLRLKNQWTQQQMADLFNARYHYNLGKSAVSQYENDKRIPEFHVLVDLADFLHVSLDYLVRGWDEKNIWVREHNEEYRIVAEIEHSDLEKMVNEVLHLLREKKWFLEQRLLSKEQVQILSNALEVGLYILKRDSKK